MWEVKQELNNLKKKNGTEFNTCGLLYVQKSTK